MPRRPRLRIVALVAVVVVLVPVFSATRYVLANPNEPLQQNIASWARTKGLGGLVDQLEAWLHNDPPAVAPVDTLTLVPTDDSTVDTIPDTTDDTVAAPDTTAPSGTPKSSTSTTTKPGSNAKPPVTRPRTATASCPSTTKDPTTTTTSTTSTTTTTSTSSTLPGETTTTTTTTSTIPSRPANVVPFIEPAIKGEGTWRVAARVDDAPHVFVNSVRPLWCYGSVVATMAAWNPQVLRTALFNGTEVPGGKGWKNGSRIAGTKNLRTLLGSFNGGFRFEHSPGGYVTEGRVVQKMVKGYATFGIRPDGTSTVGVWGKDMKDVDTWASLRQNLPPLVAEGRSVYANYPKVDWGKDYGNKVFNFRSAVCLRTDGLMMFVAVGKVNIGMLADTLVLLGCRTGMELDINGTWPQFALYGRYGRTDRTAKVIDSRMGDPMRHLNGSTKDFFGLFFSEQLLAASTSTTTVAPVVP